MAVQNEDIKVVLVGDLSSEHFDTANADGSNKVKVKFPTGNITDLKFEGNKLKFKKDGKDAEQELDLSALSADIHATGATYEASNTTLTIQKNSGGNITVDLGKLAESAIGNDAASAVTLSGNGKTGNPLKADLKLGPTKNLLKKDGQGNLTVSEDGVKAQGTAAVNEKLAALPTITLKNAFGNETLGVVYAKTVGGVGA